jgi:WD40 repeat protein
VAAASATTTETSTTLEATSGNDAEDTVEPETKKRRLDPLVEPLKNDLPADDWQILQESWELSTSGRKAGLKAAAARAPTSESLAKFTSLEQKAWHKSANRGILCMAKTTVDGSAKGLIVTAGKDKQLVVYDEVNQVVQHTFAFGTHATSVDVSVELVVAGDIKGRLAVFSLKGEDSDSFLGDLNLGAAIVDVTVHPSKQHILAATANGLVFVIACSVDSRTLQKVAIFQRDGDVEDVFTCACLHPDGLIYAVGTKKGQIQVWDFKNKLLAAILEVRRKFLFQPLVAPPPN